MHKSYEIFSVILFFIGFVIIFLLISMEYPFWHDSFWTATGKCVVISLISMVASSLIGGFADDASEEKYKKEYDV